MPGQFEKDHGTEDICPLNNGGPHEPDWGTVSLDSDGGGYYVDVLCRRCHRSGCLGQLQRLVEAINW